MFKYGVQCALEQLPERIPAVLRGSIQVVAGHASHIGYDAMELYIHNPKQYNPVELLAAARDHGLKYCGICTGLEFVMNHLCLTSDESAARQAATDRLKEHLDLGTALGCPVVVGTMRGNLPSSDHLQEYLNRLGEGLLRLDAYAEKIGGWLLVENILQYISNYLNTIEEVSDYIRSLGLKRCRLHIDTHSMHMEEKRPYDAIRASADVLGYVHFSDANRGYPGAGTIDFKSYFHTLLDVNYQGYITAECQPYPSEKVCAQRALDYMKQMEQVVLLEREPLKVK